jgi:sugar phosphate isomerase/epimerase
VKKNKISRLWLQQEEIIRRPKTSYQQINDIVSLLRMTAERANKMIYPSLTKSFKGLFPFKICTTSFIYPDMYAPNVTMLGPYLDEIELLFFDSTYDGSLPTPAQIHELSGLYKKFQLTCNVHLPLDISLGDSDTPKRLHAVETVRHIIRLTAPLNPSTYTVHFTYEEKSRLEADIALWRDRIMDSFGRILQENITPDKFSVENLVEYPFRWVDDIIARTGLHTCIDIGHFMERGEDFEPAFYKYASTTDILHIYGVKGHHDHLSLDCLSEKSVKSLIRILKNFPGTVSVEVFSFNKLSSSLALMEQWNLF